MAALDFPSNPTNGQQYIPASGVVYVYDGTVWTIASTPVGTAGGDLTGTYPNPTIGAGKVLWTNLGQRVFAVVARSGVQSIPNITSTDITWNAGATLDVGGAWNAANPERLTVPATGYYQFGAMVSFQGSAAGTVRRMVIVRRLPTAGNYACVDARPVAADQVVNVTMVLPLNAGDTLIVQVYHDVGGALNVGADGWGFLARFWLMRVG